MTKLIVKMAVTAGAVLFIMGMFIGMEESINKRRFTKTTYLSKASIEKMIDIEEVHAATRPFRSTVTRCELIEDRHGREKKIEKYSVLYSGSVNMGFNSKIDVSVDNKQKKVKIVLPEVEVLDKSVEFDSIDYIFNKKRYETETIAADTYRLCMEDMERRVSQNDSLKKEAKANFASELEKLMKPMSDKTGYMVEIK